MGLKLVTTLFITPSQLNKNKQYNLDDIEKGTEDEEEDYKSRR